MNKENKKMDIVTRNGNNPNSKMEKFFAVLKDMDDRGISAIVAKEIDEKNEKNQ